MGTPDQELWPGGDIFYLKPLQSTWRCCGFIEHDVEWTAVWADPMDLNSLVMSLRAVELHVPWIYEHAIEDVALAFQQAAENGGKAAEAAQVARSEKLPLLTRSLKNT